MESIENRRGIQSASLAEELRKKLQKYIIIRVFSGSFNNKQSNAFQCGLEEVQRDVQLKFGVVLNIEIMTNNVAKTTFEDSNELFVWLLNTDIHFILCHPHQGLVHKWKPNDIYKNITLLKNHFGFPFRSQLLCPVFTQNKYDYIYAVKDICIPTVIVSICSVLIQL